jgi:hypothetical protein
MSWHSLGGRLEIRWIQDAPEIECVSTFTVNYRLGMVGVAEPGYYLYERGHVNCLVSANHSAGTTWYEVHYETDGLEIAPGLKRE